MQAKEIFIIVPSSKYESPVQGAIALANELVNFYPITFITIKKCESKLISLKKEVTLLQLHKKGSLISRFLFLKRYLLENSRKNSVVSISIGFSADFLNSHITDYALTISSVRGNLPKVYKNNYGFAGKYFSYFHLKRLRKLDFVISMTKSMSIMVESFISSRSPIIGNFVDELAIEPYRRKNNNQGEYRFIFCGSLVYGKQPQILILAINEILKNGNHARLDIFGDGPLLNELKKLTFRLNLKNNIFFHGYIANPFHEISKADSMIIPSLSEGVSRSALEALYLGVPCVMRDIDGNCELISQGVNGELFSRDGDLSKAMIKAAKYSRSNELFRDILIPKAFRQSNAVKEYIGIIKKS